MCRTRAPRATSDAPSIVPSAVSMESLLGGQITLKAGGTVSTPAFLGDARFVLVYCSASWCPPCRAFSPALSSFVAAHAARLKLSAVFVSCDRDEKSFRDYNAKFSFDGALPPEHAAGAALMSKFGVRGIPALLVFTRDGALVTKDGVARVQADPTGAAFPWAWGGDALARDVVLRDIASDAALNGLRGRVVGAAEATKRYTVRLPGGREVSVLREKFDVVDA
jgi:nucleoredoxin